MRSKPNKELALFNELKRRKIEVFYPRVRVNPVNPRARKIASYFPGYLFIHVDLDQYGVRPLQRVPYSIGLVEFDGYAPSIADHLIKTIRTQVNEIESAGGVKLQGFEQGDPVRIQSGPFEGYEGIFDMRLPGKERVRILLQYLNDQIMPLELHIGMVQKITS
ncbi:MAG: hypothetical protein JW750_08130 [Anaerolineaceae bacterium]|nr:hypothetical protein [Anaerolineaceae bacterium]